MVAKTIRSSHGLAFGSNAMKGKVISVGIRRDALNQRQLRFPNEYLTPVGAVSTARLSNRKQQLTSFHRLRSGPFEGPATVKPPVLPVDTYSPTIGRFRCTLPLVLACQRRCKNRHNSG